MATVKRSTAASALDETIRQRVGRGTATTTYQVPISRPASVVEKQSDPDVFRSYSDGHQEQMAKFVSGATVYLLTAAVIYGIERLVLMIFDGQVSDTMVLALHVGAIICFSTIGIVLLRDAIRPGIAISDIVVALSGIAIVMVFVSYISGEEQTGALVIIALLAAFLNPWSTPRMVAGLNGLREINALKEVLYRHYEELEVEYDEPIVPRGDMMPGELLMQPTKADNSPLFGNTPYLLLRQVEDFCHIAFYERASESGNVVSGLSRSSMKGEMIGPPNNTVPGVPSSHIPVTRGTYDKIITGLVGVGLVQIANVGTVWSKIDAHSTFTSGWTMDEISERLQQYAFKAKEVGK